MFLIFAAVTLILCITTGNLFVLIAFFRTARLRRTFSNVYIASLAFADLMVGTVVMPLMLYSRQLQVLGHGEPKMVFCDFVFCVHCIFAGVTFHHLMAISVDRYLKITQIFWYKKTMTSYRVKIVVLFLWLLCAVTTLPNILSMGHKYEVACEYYVPIVSGPRTIVSVGVILTFVNIVPSLFLVICNLRLYVIATKFKSTIDKEIKATDDSNKFVVLTYHRGKVRVSTTDENSSSSHSSSKRSKGRKLKDMMAVAIKQRKASIMITLIIGAFCACWPPALIIWFLRSFYEKELNLPNWTVYLWPWLGYVNSAFNPIILYCMSEEFRKAGKNLFNCLSARSSNM